MPINNQANTLNIEQKFANYIRGKSKNSIMNLNQNTQTNTSDDNIPQQLFQINMRE